MLSILIEPLLDVLFFLFSAFPYPRREQPARQWPQRECLEWWCRQICAVMINEIVHFLFRRRYSCTDVADIFTFLIILFLLYVKKSNVFLDIVIRPYAWNMYWKNWNISTTVSHKVPLLLLYIRIIRANLVGPRAPIFPHNVPKDFSIFLCFFSYVLRTSQSKKWMSKTVLYSLQADKHFFFY